MKNKIFYKYIMKFLKKPSQFFKDIGFTTKKQAIDELRKEASERKTKIQYLFKSEDDFIAFAQNVLIPELEGEKKLEKFDPYFLFTKIVKKNLIRKVYKVDYNKLAKFNLDPLLLLANKIKKTIKKTKNFYSVTLAFYEHLSPKNSQYRRFRQLKFTKNDDANMIYKKIIGEGPEELVNYSDDLEMLDDVDTSWLAIDELRLGGGGDVPNTEHKNKKIKSIIIDDLICHEFPSKDNNCFIEILRNITEEKEKANKIREILNIEKNKYIDNNDIPLLEKYFNKKICVITGADITRQTIKPAYFNKYNLEKKNLETVRTITNYDFSIIYGDIKSDVWIILRNNHYLLVKKKKHNFFCEISGIPLRKQGKASFNKIREKFLKEGIITINKKDNKKDNKKEKKGFCYWFFDYETVYNDAGYLIPYSISCIKVQNGKNGHYTSDKFFDMSKNCNELFINWMMQKRDYNYDNILVGYNSSRFDNYILVEGLLNNDMLNSNSVFMAGNSILKLTFDSFKTLDLCRFLMVPLKNACKGFGCDLQKGTLEHKFIQDLYFNSENKDDFFKKLQKHEKEIETYNILDCESLCELFFKVKKCTKEMLNCNIEDFLTISQMSYDMWNKTDHGVLPPKKHEIANFFRKSMIAGRSQIFKPGHFKGEYQSLDVKSLYPYVMMGCQFPIGEEIETDTYISNKLGVYRCKINKQPDDNIIPFRQKDKPLNWTYKGSFECVLTSVDIENLRDFNSDIEIYEGYYWENSSSDVFKDYFNPIKEEKTRQDEYKDNGNKLYNPSKRSFCKLLLNSLSGKVGQRRFLESNKLVKNEKEINKFIEKNNDIEIQIINESDSLFLKGKLKEKKYRQLNEKPVFLAPFIYSYARTHMYKSVISKIDSKRAMDTDSLHAPIEAFKNLQQKRGFGNYNEGGEFGDFEPELDFKTRDVYYIAPKCYGLFGDEKCKMRFKGLRKNDKLINISEKEFKCKSLKEQFKIYNEAPTAMCEQLYKKLCDGEPVQIICSQIKKLITVEGEDCIFDFSKLKQTFIYKTINPPIINKYKNILKELKKEIKKIK